MKPWQLKSQTLGCPGEKIPTWKHRRLVSRVSIQRWRTQAMTFCLRARCKIFCLALLNWTVCVPGQYVIRSSKVPNRHVNTRKIVIGEIWEETAFCFEDKHRKTRFKLSCRSAMKVSIFLLKKQDVKNYHRIRKKFAHQWLLLQNNKNADTTFLYSEIVFISKNSDFISISLNSNIVHATATPIYSTNNKEINMLNSPKSTMQLQS